MSNTPSRRSRLGYWASWPQSSIAQNHAPAFNSGGSLIGIEAVFTTVGEHGCRQERGTRSESFRRRRTIMNLNIWQILVLALLQGVTELFPISSLGHTVILPGLLGWGDLVRDKHFLPLIVALHLGTSIALVIYFWRDWWKVLLTLANSIKKGEVQIGSESWVSWLIILGCIP